MVVTWRSFGAGGMHMGHIRSAFEALCPIAASRVAGLPRSFVDPLPNAATITGKALLFQHPSVRALPLHQMAELRRVPTPLFSSSLGGHSDSGLLDRPGGDEDER